MYEHSIHKILMRPVTFTARNQKVSREIEDTDQKRSKEVKAKAKAAKIIKLANTTQ